MDSKKYFNKKDLKAKKKKDKKDKERKERGEAEDDVKHKDEPVKE